MKLEMCEPFIHHRFRVGRLWHKPRCLSSLLCRRRIDRFELGEAGTIILRHHLVRRERCRLHLLEVVTRPHMDPLLFGAAS